jgi:adenosylhomocysteine nucleosidase
VTWPACEAPCVLFALARESGPFRREFRPGQRFPGAPCPARFCGPPGGAVLVVETGMGLENAEHAAGWLLSRPQLGNACYRPSVVLFAGFAGALQEGYRVGDVLLATEVVDTEGGRWAATWPESAEAAPRRGRLLTVARLVAEPAAKRALGARHGAAAVDMETAAAARACSRAGVPFGCVRVISDDVDTGLSPRLAAVLDGGRVSVPRLLGQVLRAPHLVGELWRLARHSRLAARRLGKALSELLSLPLSRGEGFLRS